LASGAFFVLAAGHTQRLEWHADIRSVAISIRTVTVRQTLHAGVDAKELRIACHAIRTISVYSAHAGLFSGASLAFIAQAMVLRRTGCSDVSCILANVVITILVAVAVAVLCAIHTCVHVKDRCDTYFTGMAIGVFVTGANTEGGSFTFSADAFIRVGARFAVVTFFQTDVAFAGIAFTDDAIVQAVFMGSAIVVFDALNALVGGKQAAVAYLISWTIDVFFTEAFSVGGTCS